MSSRLQFNCTYNLAEVLKCQTYLVVLNGYLYSVSTIATQITIKMCYHRQKLLSLTCLRIINTLTGIVYIYNGIQKNKIPMLLWTYHITALSDLVHKLEPITLSNSKVMGLIKLGN